MRDRAKLTELDLSGSPNYRRALQRKAEEERSAEGRYGIPPRPDYLDTEESKVWTVLVVELRDKLFETDARALVELIQVELLLADSLTCARQFQTYGNNKAHPAHANAERYFRLRGKLRKQFTSRVSRPEETNTGASNLAAILAGRGATN